MSVVLEFKVPASFLVERWALPTSAELGYGFRMGWVGRPDVVEIALRKYEFGAPISPAEQEIALLLTDELDRVEELSQALEISDQPAERRARYWAFAILASLWELRGEYRDPYGMIDMIYAEFDYPEELAPLASFTALSPADAPGLEGIDQRWQDLVGRWRAEYQNRDLEYVQPE